MKVTIFRLKWALPVAAALAANVSLAIAQRPLEGVELIKPIEAAPMPRAALEATSATPLADSAPSEPTPISETTPPADSAAPLREPAGSPPTAPKNVDDLPREMVRERFGNGAVRIEREMIQDADGNFIRHGVYREYDLKGTLILEGEYNHGRREGVWQRQHAATDSPLFETAPYKDCKGPFLSQAHFTDGLLDGRWIIADSQQRRISEISFAMGARHGSAAWYYPTGSLMTQITYDRGRVHGDVVKWGADSAILAKENFQHGRQVATKIDYFEKNDLKRREIAYLNAMLYARVPDDWDKAQLAVFETRGQDEKHGPFKTWHANGNLARQGEFRYDLPVGPITYWYENGQPQMEGAYVDGRPHGIWTWYHPNGQKSIVGEYQDGTAIGSWTWWQADGKVARKADMTKQRPAPVVQGLPQPTPQIQQRDANLRIELVEPGMIQR